MGERVFLVRDRDNEHDLYATRVQTQSGQVIGWGPRQKTSEVGAWLDSGQFSVAGVASRGSAPGKDLVGVNIEIMLVGPSDRRAVETELWKHERWKRKELERQSAPAAPGSVPAFQVTERDDFPKWALLVGAVVALFVTCVA